MGEKKKNELKDIESLLEDNLEKTSLFYRNYIYTHPHISLMKDLGI